MDNTAQEAAFRAALKRLSSEIHPDLLALSYLGMIEELKSAMRSLQQKGERNPIRYFARRHLGLRGENVDRLVRGWMKSGEAMSEEHIVLVLRTLSNLRGPFDVSPLSQKELGIIRQLVSFIIMTLTKILGIITEIDAKPVHVDEGDRMEMRRLLKGICARLGIDVTFHEDTTNSRPVTRAELVKIGLASKIQREK